MKFKLEIIKEGVNISYAIHWVTENIANTFILSDK